MLQPQWRALLANNPSRQEMLPSDRTALEKHAARSITAMPQRARQRYLCRRSFADIARLQTLALQ